MEGNTNVLELEITQVARQKSLMQYGLTSKDDLIKNAKVVV